MRKRETKAETDGVEAIPDTDTVTVSGGGFGVPVGGQGPEAGASPLGASGEGEAAAEGAKEAS